MFQKFLDFVVSKHFFVGAGIGGGGAFGLQILLLGDVSFWLFWFLNLVGAGIVGSAFRWFK